MNSKQLASLEKQWDRLVSEGQPLTFRKGQVLFYEGHTPYGLFVIQSGKVRFLRGDHPCDQNHLWSSPKGNVIGLHHFFDGPPFCCTCLASDDCQVIFISKTQLLPFVKS